MKNKKLQAGSQWLIVAIVAILIATIAVVGMSKVKAEPTIYDLVQTPEIGTFKPNELYVDGETPLTPVALLDTNHIFIPYDKWVDTSGDGIVDVEDFYSVEGFESQMLFGQNTYFIYETTKTSNSYVVYFHDFASFEAVVTQLQIANYNDQGEVKDTSSYYFDSERNLLYIKKSLIEKEIKNENYLPIRCESIRLFKSMTEFNREIAVMTAFDPEIKDLHGLDKVATSDYMKFNVKNWFSDGYIYYKLVPSEYIAYLSNESMDVYLDDMLMDTSTWSYNETTGYIRISCEPVTISQVTVHIKQLNDVTEQQAQLLATQASNNEMTAVAAEYSDVLKENNPFLKCLHYEESEPVVGTTDGLGFTCWTIINITNDGTPFYDNHNPQPFFYDKASKESASKSYLREAINNSIDETKVVNKRYQSATLSIFNGNGVWSDGTRPDQLAGAVVVNMRVFEHTNDMQYLQNANTIIKNKFLENVGQNNTLSGLLTTSWRNSETKYDARYLSGTHHTDFLGSTKQDGYVLFDGVCGRIEEPNKLEDVGLDEVEWKKIMKGSTNSVHGTSCDYHAYATIVEKSATDLYIMFWSKTVMKESYTKHSQRVLGFSRVAYTYAGMGEVTFEKINDKHEYIEGAHYQIYQIGDDTQPVREFDTQNAAYKFELPVGRYYYVETQAPVGYKLDPQKYEFAVTQEHTKPGNSLLISAFDEHQECEVIFTVYDQTTEEYQYKAPVPGIQFMLYDKATGQLYQDLSSDDLTTDANGQIHFVVPTTSAGYTLQQKETVKDYCLFENHDVEGEERYNCSAIDIPAIADDTGIDLILDADDGMVHYEHRQTIDIQSQVQDQSLLDATPCHLGGTEGGEVETLGATYQLVNKEKIFLGYKDDAQRTKIEVPANTVLTIETADSRTGDSLVYTQTAVSHPDSDGKKSFVTASHIRYDGEEYPVPNGIYEWRLLTTSKGYYNNNLHTQVNAEWSLQNMKKQHMTVVKFPVIQTRQTVDIELFVKTYDRLLDINAAGVDNPNFKSIGLVASYDELKDRMDTNGMLSGYKADHVKSENSRKHINTNSTEETKKISSATIEDVNIIRDSKVTASFQTNGVLGGAVYYLVTTCDIVDIETGFTIPSNTTLAIINSDEYGRIYFSEYQAKPTLYYNEGNELLVFESDQVIGKSANDQMAVSGNLPTGTYKVLLVHYPSNGTQEYTGALIAEYGIENDLINDTAWTEENQSSITLSSQSMTGLRYNKDKPDAHTAISVMLAPDVPVDPDDPYDPLNPDDPTDSDDSKDITRIEDLYVKTIKEIYDLKTDITPEIGNNVYEWIKNHKLDIAYRIIDLTNVIKEKDNEGKDQIVDFDVSDTLPTTMAFTYINNTIIDKEMYDYRYTMKFYYEIDKTEFDSAPDALKHDPYNSDPSKRFVNHDAVYKAIDYNYDGLADCYAMRFAEDGIAGGEYLRNVIVLNENSTGFIDYQELKRTDLGSRYIKDHTYTTISGAIFNYDWINKRMQQEINQDGTYHILVEFGMECTKTSVTDGSTTEVDYSGCLNYGVLTIKNRELFELD